PIVTAESPIALARMVRFQQSFGYSGKNFFLSPFPVDEQVFDVIAPLSARKNRIISVARWSAHQKNLPLLLRTLDGFLNTNPTWDAVLPGSLPAGHGRLMKRYCPQTSGRIQMTGPLPNREVSRQLAESKIYLTTSRHEGFSISVAEALCSGCSLVGPHHIPGTTWCCGSNSGTVATLYTKNGFLDALSAEAREWAEGNRSPETIAATWQARVGSKYVAGQMITLLEQLG
ncbi:MAG: glycosyltransferase, partial [Terrimicrobiaceae bacterium]